MADFLLRPETPADYRAEEALTREAFWNVYRPGCREHYLVHRYRGRKGFVPELDLVLEMGGQLVGHIMYVHAAIHSDSGPLLPVMTFGPISILPEYQRRGLGKALLEDSLARAAALGAKAICIEGNLAFYGKSGFVPAAGTDIRYNDEPVTPPYFLLKELAPGYLHGLSGAYRTPEGYLVDEAEALRFDASFPPKQRLKLPGQLA